MDKERARPRLGHYGVKGTREPGVQSWATNGDGGRPANKCGHGLGFQYKTQWALRARSILVWLGGNKSSPPSQGCGYGYPCMLGLYNDAPILDENLAFYEDNDNLADMVEVGDIFAVYAVTDEEYTTLDVDSFFSLVEGEGENNMDYTSLIDKKYTPL